jgi:hypothetical protein
MTNKHDANDEKIVADPVLLEKLIDAESTPSLEVEFDPDEAEQLGAFEENALDATDALESSADFKDYTYHGQSLP